MSSFQPVRLDQIEQWQSLSFQTYFGPAWLNLQVKAASSQISKWLKLGHGSEVITFTLFWKRGPTWHPKGLALHIDSMLPLMEV